MNLVRVLSICVAAGMTTGLAQAADLQVYFSPEITPEFTAPAPSGFDGLYAGVLFGPISSRMGNFVVGGQPIRPEFGAVIGWNQPVLDGVAIGGELQGTVASDFAGSTYYRLMALARLGFAAGDNTLIYALGGVGRMGDGWAYEAGIGTEVMVTDRITARLEAAAIGQLGDVPSGVSIPRISALRITGGAIWQLDGPPAATGFNNDGMVTDFSGAYAGINLGSLADPRFSFFWDWGYGWHMSRFEIGTIAGYNYAPSDLIRVGVEGQLGVNFDTSGDAGIDALGLARVGIVPIDGLMAYAAGGVGVVESRPAYAIGGGLEYALWGDTTLRGEALVLYRLDGTDGGAPERFVTTKVTLGAIWHFD
jgi:hypothetical protein